MPQTFPVGDLVVDIDSRHDRFELNQRKMGLLGDVTGRLRSRWKGFINTVKTTLSRFLTKSLRHGSGGGRGGVLSKDQGTLGERSLPGQMNPPQKTPIRREAGTKYF